MSASTWAPVIATIGGALLGGSIVIYVNAPRRKVLLDEIAILEHVEDDYVRRRLHASVERRARDYVRRTIDPRVRDPLWARAFWWFVVVLGVVLLPVSLITGQWWLTFIAVAGIASNGSFILIDLRRVNRVDQPGSP